MCVCVCGRGGVTELHLWRVFCRMWPDELCFVVRVAVLAGLRVNRLVGAWVQAPQVAGKVDTVVAEPSGNSARPAVATTVVGEVVRADGLGAVREKPRRAKNLHVHPLVGRA